MVTAVVVTAVAAWCWAGPDDELSASEMGLIRGGFCCGPCETIDYTLQECGLYVNDFLPCGWDPATGTWGNKCIITVVYGQNCDPTIHANHFCQTEETDDDLAQQYVWYEDPSDCSPPLAPESQYHQELRQECQSLDCDTDCDACVPHLAACQTGCGDAYDTADDSPSGYAKWVCNDSCLDD